MSKHARRSMTVALMAVALAAASRPVMAGSVQGVVKDTSGSPVTGAFVKVNNPDRRLIFMVVSQEQGRYTVDGLPAGKYTVQGVGGDYQSEMSAPIDVAASGKATVEVKLTQQRAPDLPHAWPGRPPGQGGGEAEAAGARKVELPDGEGKRIALTKCSMCHDAERIATTRASEERWKDIIEEMRTYMQGSSQAKDLTDAEAKALTDYVLQNFAGNRPGRTGPPVPDPNSRLPRTLQTGQAAKYITVEFTLPDTKVEPHEVAADLQGNAWVTQRTGGRLGRFDRVSMQYREVDPPKAKSKNRLNGIVRAPDGRLWFLDGGPNRRWLNYDVKSNEFNVFALPKLKTGAASGNTMRVHPNGTVWLNSISANQVISLDPKTKDFKVYDVPSGVKAGKTANPYGMAIDGAGNVWSVENNMNKMLRINPNTGKMDEFDIPLPNSVPRKAGMDSQGNVWVGLHGAGKLMKVDYKTTKMTIYTPPTPEAGVYSVQGDPTSRYVWFAEQQADQIARFDPQAESFLEFPLPTAEEDHRRIEMDPLNPNRVWWSGDTSGRMGYVELLTGDSKKM